MSTLLGDARIRIRPDLTGFQAAAQSGVGTSLAKVGKLAGITLGAAAVASFAASTINIGKTYQSTLNNLQAVSGASASQMAAVSKTAKALGSDLTLTSTSAADAATAMTELAKGGLTVDAAMKAARGTLQLAAAAGIEAGEAATIQSAALNAFNLEANQAGRVADVLANAANAAAGEITDFSQGMAQASAVAAATGISLEDTAATLGLLANNGIKGSDAGTLLKSALLALQSPSAPAAAAMRDLAVSAYDASGNFVGLSAIFGQLSEAQKRMTPEAYAMATSTLFGSDAARLAGIAGREGAEGFDAMAEAMGKSGSAADVAAAKAKGVDGAIEAFTSQLETLQIEIFEKVAPALESVIRLSASLLSGVTDLAGTFSDLPGSIHLGLGALVAWKLGGDRVTSGIVALRESLSRLRDDIPVQQALYRAQASSLTDMERAFGGLGTGATTAGGQVTAVQRSMWGWDDQLARTTVEMNGVTAATGRFNGALALAKSAGSGIAAFFGGPVGLALIAVVGSFALLSSATEENAVVTSHASEAQEGLAAALRETKGVIDETVRSAAAKSLQDAGLLDIAEKAGIALPRMTDAILGNKDAYNEVSGALATYMYGRQLASGYEEHGETTLHDQAAAAKQAVKDFDFLSQSLGKNAEEQSQLAEATGASSEATAVASEAAIAALEKWLEALNGVASAFVDPLSAYTTMVQEVATATADATSDSSDSWSDYVADVDVSLDELAVRLQEQITNQEDWRTNIGKIAAWAGVDVAQHLAQMGQDGVGLVAQMADGTDAEAQRMADLIREDIRLGGMEWTTAMDQEMTNLQAIAAAGGQRSAASLAYELGIGVDQVAAIAARYGIVLADGINPLLGALGARQVAIQKRGANAAPNNGATQRPGFWDGGYTGDGGKFEPKGVVHGGEYVFTKEETSRAGVQNLAAYAKSLRGYASGGFVTPRDVPLPSSTSPYQSPISTAANATMQTGYDEVTAWLRANAETAQGGTAGSGSIGGAWSAIWQVVKAAFPAARINSTFRAGDPGYHGRNKAIDFGHGAGPGGAGNAGLAAIARFLYQGYGSSLAELIYTGVGDNTPDVKNGRNHVYNAATRAGHRNHVHAAVYDTGGVLQPGMTLVDNRSRKPEGVLNNEQLRWLQAASDGGGSGPLIGGDLVLRVDPRDDVRDQMETAMHELRRIKRGGGVR